MPRYNEGAPEFCIAKVVKLCLCEVGKISVAKVINTYTLLLTGAERGNIRKRAVHPLLKKVPTTEFIKDKD